MRHHASHRTIPKGQTKMYGVPLLDAIAFALFALAWLAYHHFVENASRDSGSLNGLMNDYRVRWMEEMSEREVRILDSAIMSSLQGGTAFFASSSLIAIGGAVTLLRATDDVLRIFSDLPFGLVVSRGLWEAKVIGLATIFGYAFFKFSWSYRLFNYAAILLGATPEAADPDTALRRQTSYRAARMGIAAARHFSRGQRAFFFALAYLGWFISPYVLIVATAATLFAMWSRQFNSDARRAIAAEPPEIRFPRRDAGPRDASTTDYG